MEQAKSERLNRRAFLRGATATTGGLVGVSAVSTLTTLGCQNQSSMNRRSAIARLDRGGKDGTDATMTEAPARRGTHYGERTKIYTVLFATAPSGDDRSSVRSKRHLE